jgi:hypothetical protein
MPQARSPKSMENGKLAVDLPINQFVVTLETMVKSGFYYRPRSSASHGQAAPRVRSSVMSFQKRAA